MVAQNRSGLRERAVSTSNDDFIVLMSNTMKHVGKSSSVPRKGTSKSHGGLYTQSQGKKQAQRTYKPRFMREMEKHFAEKRRLEKKSKKTQRNGHKSQKPRHNQSKRIHIDIEITKENKPKVLVSMYNNAKDEKKSTRKNLKAKVQERTHKKYWKDKARSNFQK